MSEGGTETKVAEVTVTSGTSRADNRSLWSRL
jgi:hypothetical protein